MHTLLTPSQLNTQNQGIKEAQWAIQSERFVMNSFAYMNHPTELREKMFRRSRKALRNFYRKLNLLFRFKLEKYLYIIVAVLPLIAKM